MNLEGAYAVTTPNLLPEGSFANFEGGEYRISGWRVDTMILRAYGSSPPPGFEPRQGHWQRAIPTSDLDRMFVQESTCWWHGAHFVIDLVGSDTVEAAMLMEGRREPRAELTRRPEISEDPRDARGSLLGKLSLQKSTTCLFASTTFRKRPASWKPR
ncbi:MAG: hypothetical protein JWN03_3101 [Nocardia sp.]|nr:hypothetical protein [Nocardia sp.]